MPNLTPHSRQISPSDQGGSEDNISGKTRVKTLQLMLLDDTQNRLQYSKNSDHILATYIIFGLVS